jgi:hypothetical protein
MKEVVVTGNMLLRQKICCCDRKYVVDTGNEQLPGERCERVRVDSVKKSFPDERVQLSQPVIVQQLKLLLL